ncbi:hypothetical protein GIB67_037176 [Kingdonia uniflora]|uniref:Beta-glucosidase n=1 Tax=Kingdonia uniflora TaxID=39325 RepID=A0A7J7MRW2_9MAGN|nr:hypothetical protein GIB67_037176 [Kingdonia uniflora]
MDLEDVYEVTTSSKLALKFPKKKTVKRDSTSGTMVSEEVKGEAKKRRVDPPATVLGAKVVESRPAKEDELLAVENMQLKRVLRSWSFHYYNFAKTSFFIFAVDNVPRLLIGVLYCILNDIPAKTDKLSSAHKLIFFWLRADQSLPAKLESKVLATECPWCLDSPALVTTQREWTCATSSEVSLKGHLKGKKHLEKEAEIKENTMAAKRKGGHVSKSKQTGQPIGASRNVGSKKQASLWCQNWNVSCSGPDMINHFSENIFCFFRLFYTFDFFNIIYVFFFLDGDGKVHWKGVAYCNRLIDYLLEKGITPYANLYHYDLLEALEQQYNGLFSLRVVKAYVDYVDFCFKTFGNRVKNWMTFYEPRVIFALGYDNGFFAPARCPQPNGNYTTGNSTTEPYIIGHHLIIMHASVAQRYYHKYQATQKGRIKILLHFVWYEPLTRSKADNISTQRAKDFHLGW